MWRGLDLVGALLCGRTGVGGITFWAVGTGDPAWGDGTPPSPDPGQAALTAEVARGRLAPGDVTVDAATQNILFTVTVPDGGSAQPLRELALFGGSASPRPGSGWLVSLLRHPPVSPDGALTRSVQLSLPAGLLPGATDVIAALLTGAGSPPAEAISWLAVGTGEQPASPPPPGLSTEIARAQLGGGGLAYDPHTRQLTATASFAYDDAPGVLTETGLFAGTGATGASGTGTLVAYATHAAIDRSQPSVLSERFVLALSTDDAVAVPNLVGQLIADAGAALSTAGLTVGATTQSTDDEHPRGTVLAQTPAAGAAAHPGWEVDLTLSIPTQVQVPPLVGASAAAVPGLLQAPGLVVDTADSTTQEDPAPAGTVLSATPPAGTTVDKGSGVALVTATPITAVVPDVRGQTPDAAAALLAGTGFTLAPVPYQTQESDLTAGTILTQTPAPGARVPVGATVTPVLATGWTVTVPDLTGMTLDDAAAALAAAGKAVLDKLGRSSPPSGLALGARTPQESTAVAGTILQQVPAANSQANLYGVVDVVYATIPTDAAPDVTGRSQVDAAAAIVAAGLTVGTISTRMKGDPTDPTDQTVAGTVLDQQPPAGTHWPAGAAVTLTVSTPLAAAVPDVTGQPIDVARETLGGRTFTVGTITSEAAGGAPGTVSAQAPGDGTMLPLGQGVALTVVVGVPNLVGLTVDAARADLGSLGITLGAVTNAPSSAPTGTIIAQTPPPGSAANADTTVQITTAAPLQVQVPDLTGVTIDGAQATLTKLGLTLSVGGTQPSTSAPGTVVSQVPQAGSAVPPGSTVTVTTAVPEPTQFPVPNLVGMDQPTAQATLSATNLMLNVTGQQPSPNQAALTVLSQDPAAGTAVGPGTTVNVVLVAPPDANTVVVPDVRGLPQANATAALTGAGLTVATLGQASTAAAGTVLSQSPLPGGRVPTGSAVSITVAVPPPVTVPDVIGLAQAAASQAVTAAGLVPRFTLIATTLVGLREVVSQQPQGGSQVARGSTVTMTTGLVDVLPPPKPIGIIGTGLPRLLQ